MYEWLLKYWDVLLFYLAISIIVYINRSKFEFEGKVIALYKTKFGIEAMKRFVLPVSKTKQKIGFFMYNFGFYVALVGLVFIIINLLSGIFTFSFLANLFEVTAQFIFFAYILFFLGSFLVIISMWFGQLERVGILGIYVGYLGMVAILGMVFYGLYQLIFEPQAPPMFTPVLPGFQVPGGPQIPLIQGLLALFVVVVIHEFAHGVISKLYKIRIKSSGFAMFGPIPAAFVEPDQKKLEKASPKKQLAMYAAGPFSNVLLAIVMVALINLIALGTLSWYAPSGLEIVDFTEEDDRFLGVSLGEEIIAVNNISTTSLGALQRTLQEFRPGDTINISTNKNVHEIELVGHPQDENWSYLGVSLYQQVSGNNNFLESIKTPYFWFVGKPYSTTIDESLGLLGWIFILTLGIGLVNLLPIGPVDGGRMFYLALRRFLSEKTATWIWTKVSLLLVLFIIILIFVPIIRNLF